MKKVSHLARFAGATIVVAVLLGSAPLSVAQDYDVVITDGRVMDPETGYDAIANVGINAGAIAVITEEPITGRQTIDATGHVVAPGFIDLHAHGQNLGDYRMQAMQGVTTMLELESGVLPISGWYEMQAQLPLPINYGAAAGWTFARIATFTDTDPALGGRLTTEISTKGSEEAEEAT